MQINFLARAWYVAGQSKPNKITPLGSFETWSTAIGGILETAGIHSFLGNSADLCEEADSGIARDQKAHSAWQ